MSLQPFKENDVTEKKVTDAFLTLLNDLGVQRDNFYTNAYETYVLGDVIYALKASPLAGPISQSVFRESFFAIHEFFTRPGTFEFYLQVFRAVWGNAVEVTFEVPAPGKLLITIEALSISADDFLARRIENNAYVYDEVVDQNGDNVEFQTTTGLKTQNETDALLYELCPAGVWVQGTLVVA